MAITLYHVGRTPGQKQFGLDSFTESYKAAESAAIVLTDPTLPQKGDPHPNLPFMFLTDRQCVETGEKSSALDLIYAGCLTDDGEGNPHLPPRQHEDDMSVMSASSSKAATGLVVTSPNTVQFYAPVSTLSWITYNAKGDKTDVPDPDGQPIVITLTIGDTTFSATSFDIAAIVAAFFSVQTDNIIRSQEIVAGGKYYLNTAKKVMHFVPYIFNLPPGYYPVPFASGSGYELGDLITVSSGGTCTLQVTNLFLGGQILGVSIVSNSLSVASSTPIAASGGHGSGASYTVIHVT